MRLLKGACFVSIILAFTSCRVGNNVQEPEIPKPVSGYYDTQAEKVRFCTAVKGDDGVARSNCVDTTTNYIPDDIKSVMSNPVLLLLADETGGTEDLLVSPRGSGVTLPIVYNKDSKGLTFDGSGPPRPFLGDPACTSSLRLREEGQVITTDFKQTSKDSQVTISGRIQMKIEVIENFQQPACQTLFKFLFDCYASVDLCGGQTDDDNLSIHVEVMEVFGAFIQLGVLKAQDVPNLLAMSYEITYE